MFAIVRRPLAGLAWLYLFLTLAVFTFAADQFSVHGTVKDASGAVIAGAKVELLRNSQVVAGTESDREGNYELKASSAGKYQMRVSAHSFQSRVTDLETSASAEAPANFVLRPQSLDQQITVTATGLPTPEAQVGFPVSVVKQEEFPTALNVQQPLRLIPGVQMSQIGQTGNTTSLYIRGGGSDASKVLVDGLPASFVGGTVEFAALPATGIDQVEVLRGPNSALYGSDALAGVVSLTTARGSTPLPEVAYSADGGNFGTYFQQGTLAGAYKGLDYFSAFSALNTRNGEPDNSEHNATYAGNFGWTAKPGTTLRATVRHVANHVAAPNALDLYAIPDAAGQKGSGYLRFGDLRYTNHPALAQPDSLRNGSSQRNI